MKFIHYEIQRVIHSQWKYLLLDELPIQRTLNCRGEGAVIEAQRDA